jgi:hypothetical protein
MFLYIVFVFSGREELRAEGLESLINAIELVGNALNHIHLPDGSRVKILGFALFDYMLEMLEDSNEGLLRAFTVQVRYISILFSFS